jgi:molybdate transport system ATP-binding protein
MQRLAALRGVRLPRPRVSRASHASPLLCAVVSSRWPCNRSVQTLSPRTTISPSASLSPSQSSTEADPEPALLALPPHYALHKNEVHCFLGLNGSGKSRLLQQIQDAAQRALALPASGRRVRIGTLSFDEHRAFVREHGERVVADVLGGIASPDARDLIVRLGLYPVWDSHVRHLSTGEIRKVLLAVALLRVPRATVLALDQPFDGLDKKARQQLAWMLGQLTRGFTRLLVETGARNEAFAYKTQVLLVANRLDHVLPDILSHVVLTKKSETSRIEMRPWANPDEPDEMLAQLREFLHGQVHTQSNGHDHTSPSVSDEKIESLVEQLYADSTSPDPTRCAIELKSLSVAYGRRLLLKDLDFQRPRHAHWVLLGPNGSGKSSLMRVLLQSHGHGHVAGEFCVNGDRLAVVSTDHHMEMVENDALADKTALQWLTESAQQDGDAVETVVQLLGISRELLPRKFRELSQGEQKLVQIASAIACRPHVLILDEITHGLDMFNRDRVLRAVNALGRVAAGHTHLILITHHEDEIVACFEDVFEIHEQTLRRVERE